ncbi:hypothetical protein [Acidocella sp.]|jgi:hypothetical protein|uniref:hypothetical protein n=1 Tax=Acidocella sp. TaxID=50710 RepID=UPI002F40D752
MASDYSLLRCRGKCRSEEKKAAAFKKAAQNFCSFGPVALEQARPSLKILFVLDLRLCR